MSVTVLNRPTTSFQPEINCLLIKWPLICPNQMTYSELDTQFIIWVRKVNVALDNSDATETVQLQDYVISRKCGSENV